MRAARLWNSSLVLQLNYEAAQHGCEVALERRPSLARQLCSALVRSGLLHLPCLALPCPALRRSALAGCRPCFSSSQQNTVSGPRWKGQVCSLTQRGADLQRQKSSPRVPDWSVMHMRTQNPHCLIGFKSTVPIV